MCHLSPLILRTGPSWPPRPRPSSYRPCGRRRVPPPALSLVGLGADRPTGQHIGDELAVPDDEGAVDQDVPDAGRRTGAVGIGCLVADGVRIEHNDVGVAALL